MKNPRRNVALRRRRHLRKRTSTPALPFFASNAFLRFLPQGLPYVFITRQNLKKCDWFIFHTELTQQIGFRILRDVKARFDPVFANPLYIIFLNKKAPSDVPHAIDRQSVDDLWTQVEELEKAFRRGDPDAEHWAFSALKTAYRIPAAPIYFIRNLAKNIFSPKTLVVSIGRGGGFFPTSTG